MDSIERIFNLMSQNNVNAKQLAEITELSPPVFTQWKKGLQKPSVEAIIKIARYFNISTDYLLGLTDSVEKSLDTNEPNVYNRHNLDDDAQSLLHMFNKLNDKGKGAILFQAGELLKNPLFAAETLGEDVG